VIINPNTKNTMPVAKRNNVLKIFIKLYTSITIGITKGSRFMR
jgi:hypothetical protein